MLIYVGRSRCTLVEKIATQLANSTSAFDAVGRMLEPFGFTRHGIRRRYQ